MEQLLEIQSLNITLAGSSDIELPDIIIGRGVEKPKSLYLTKDKCESLRF